MNQGSDKLWTAIISTSIVTRENWLRGIASVPYGFNKRCENRERTHLSRPGTHLAVSPLLRSDETGRL
jgi:hypothetical protein